MFFQQKRMETALIELFQSLSPPIEPDAEWKQIRERIQEAEQFKVIEQEENRVEIFKKYIKSLQDACGHHHGGGGGGGQSHQVKKKKEKKKKKKHEHNEVKQMVGNIELGKRRRLT